MIFFTSDWHIGHDVEFLYGPRGFSSIKEHDAAVLKNCNEIVRPEDTLYILGDLAMKGDLEAWDGVYKNLNCKNVHFIIGNHDTDNKINRYVNEYHFINDGYGLPLKPSKRLTFFLTHYPTLTGNFDFDQHPVWNISGHTHSKGKFTPKEDAPIYNVSLDAHDMYPVSMDQVVMDIRWFYKNILMR